MSSRSRFKKKFVSAHAVPTFDQPMLIYHEHIAESQEICLPLINKVIDGKLVLQGYTLDSGHCKALATSIKETQKP